MMYAMMMFALLPITASASAEPWRPKNFEAAVAESHRGYHPKRFQASHLADVPKKFLALVGHSKVKKSKAPWTTDDDDEYVYGEHASEGGSASDYSISQFINTDDAQADDDSDDDD